jgi:hypothetical protein
LSEKQKLFYALYLQEKPKIVIALCPATSTYLFDEDYQVEMASIILRDIGYNVSRDLRDAKRQLRRGLPEVNYAGGHSFEEIKIFLNKNILNSRERRLGFQALQGDRNRPRARP